MAPRTWPGSTRPDASELADPDWFDSDLRTIGMYLDGRGLRDRGPRGELIVDDSYLLVFHSGDDLVSFTLPEAPWATSYEVVIDTASPAGVGADNVAAGSALPVGPRTTMMLRVVRA